jgi:hypothetical protein
MAKTTGKVGDCLRVRGLAVADWTAFLQQCLPPTMT